MTMVIMKILLVLFAIIFPLCYGLECFVTTDDKNTANKKVCSATEDICAIYEDEIGRITQKCWELAELRADEDMKTMETNTCAGEGEVKDYNYFCICNKDGCNESMDSVWNSGQRPSVHWVLITIQIFVMA